MELLADESVDRQIVEALRSNAHAVKAIVEVCPGSTDEDVLALADERELKHSVDKDPVGESDRSSHERTR